MGTIVVDRIVDMICLAVTVGIAFIFESDKILGFLEDNQSEASEETSGLGWKTIAFGLLVLGGIVLWLFRNNLMETKLFQKFEKIVKGFWEGIQTVRKLEKPGLFIFHSLSIWVLFFIMNWLGFQAFPPTAHLGLNAALNRFCVWHFGVHYSFARWHGNFSVHGGDSVDFVLQCER